MEDQVKLEDNFKEYHSSWIMRGFALGMRELVLFVVLGVVLTMCIVFAVLFGVSKSELQTAQAKGVLFDKTCFSRGCLDTISYTLDLMNVSVKPCENFYEYACGNYRNFRPLDADNRDHKPLRDLFLKNTARLKNLIERPVRNTEWASERKLKHLFSSCMDDYTQEKLKGKPFIDKVLGKMGGWYVLGNWNESSWDLNNALKLVQSEFWMDALWAPRVGWDWNDKKKRIQIIQIYPPIFTWKDERSNRWWSNEDFFFDPTFQNDYQNYMHRVAKLLVRDASVHIASKTLKKKVQQFVTDAFTIESHISLAFVHTKYSNSFKRKITLDDLTKVTGNLIDWTQQMTHLFDTSDVNGKTKVNVINLDYLKGMVDVIKHAPSNIRKRVLHNYLVWRAIERYISDLSVEYNHANRKLYEDVNNRNEFQGRWNYCFRYSKNVMGDAVGALFIRDHFGSKNREKVKDITRTLKQALKTMLRETSWMDETTRNAAGAKLNVTTFKLGYPDYMAYEKKVDAVYSKLPEINETDWFGNVLKINAFRQTQWNTELKNGEDRSKWSVKIFDTVMGTLHFWNEVLVPAGVLQRPLYSYDMPHYYTFGSIGSYLGHFIVQLVDRLGSSFDENGDYVGKSWWTGTTKAAYQSVRKCVINAYTNVTQGPVIGHNSKTIYQRISKEFMSYYSYKAIAVTSGLHLAYKSYLLWLSEKGEEKSAPTGIGLTDEQLFFIAFGQTYCYNTDKHILYHRLNYTITGDISVNMAVSQLPEFSKAFHCSSTAKMNPPNKCKLF